MNKFKTLLAIAALFSTVFFNAYSNINNFDKFQIKIEKKYVLLKEGNFVFLHKNGSILYSINGKKISFTIVNDHTFKITTNNFFYNLNFYPDETQYSVVLDDELMYYNIVDNFLNSLTTEELQTFNKERMKLGGFFNFIANQKTVTKSKDDCEEYRDKAIMCFVLCEETSGLGCLCGVYYLYKEWEACK